MSFTPGQQGDYRPMAAAAWALHCARAGLDPKDKPAYEAWRAAELRKATGHASTKDCNRGRHFERAMAHFEALADAGIHWQLRLLQGDLKRIRYAVAEVNHHFLAQFRTNADLERYAKSIAAQAGYGQTELYQLDDAQIRAVTQALRIAAHREAA